MKKYRICLFGMLIAVIVVLICANKDEIFHRGEITQPAQAAETGAADEPLSAVSGEDENSCMVCPSGEPVGIYVKTKGVLVIGTNGIETEDGTHESPCEGLIRAGDYIMRINGEPVNEKAVMAEMVKNSGGQEMLFRVCRDNQYFNIKIAPVKNKDGEYAMGLWVKDDISGIGTITFTDGDRFAALGHSINDTDTGNSFRVSDGAIYETQIVRIKKPESGRPGRLEGVINYSSQYVTGRVEENSAYGIHGYLTAKQKEAYEGKSLVPVGASADVHTGNAYLLSSVSGESRQYEINILSVDSDSGNGKCMEFEVTDPTLLSLTGGIVQGMSGTPILQDGKLIGAVTHVFVNDATRGYGIFIETMMQ